MRILIGVPLLALAACNVEKDPANDQVTVRYDQELAENTAQDVGNTAEGIGAAIANEAEDTAAKIQNTDVDVNTNAGSGEAANRQ